MDSSTPIKFDIEVLLHRAAMRAVEAALTTTHGAVFSRAFLDDHRAAIDHVVRQRLHGCGEAQAAVLLKSLNKPLLRRP